MKLAKKDFLQIDELQKMFPCIPRKIIILIYKQQFGRLSIILEKLQDHDIS